MRSRLAKIGAGREDGWVIVIAVVVMTLMLGLGLAVAKVVDNQARLSGTERTRESSFNLAEGLLTAEAKLLQRSWPSKPMCTGNVTGCALPTAAVNAAGQNACTNLNAATYPNQCPNPTEVADAFRNVDTRASASWSIQLRDDRVCPTLPNPVYFRGTAAANCPTTPGGVDATNTGCVNDSNAAFVCNYDYNGGSPNRRMWVRIDATVNGRTRSIVALLQLEKLGIPFPANAVTAGSVNFTNAGNKVIVDTQSPSSVIARCSSPGATTLAGNLFNNNLSFLVNSSTPGDYPAGLKYVLGSGGSAETVTIAAGGSIIDPLGSGKVRITLTSAAAQPHSPGDRFLRAPGQAGNTCEQWIHGVQVTPQFNYIENPTYSNALSAAQLSLIEEGGATIYPAGTCPPSTLAGWSGQIVILQAQAAGCTLSIPGNAPVNSPSAPGFIIVVDQAGGAASGPALTMPNNTTYYGVVYMVNQQGADGTKATPDPPVLSIGSNAQICGGVAVDGKGAVFIGQANNGNSAVFCNNHQTGASIIFDPTAFNAFSAAGAAGLVQNTWRELVAGQ